MTLVLGNEAKRSVRMMPLGPQPRFEVYSHFRIRTSPGARVRLSWVEPKLRKLVRHLIEKPTDHVIAGIERPAKAIDAEELRKKLSPEKALQFSQLWQLLKFQGIGQRRGKLDGKYTAFILSTDFPTLVRMAALDDHYLTLQWMPGHGDSGWSIGLEDACVPSHWVKNWEILTRL